MKLKFWDRVILFLGALLTIIAGAWMIVTAFQLPGLSGQALELPLWQRALLIGVGALTVIFGGFLLLLPRKFKYSRHDFVVQQTDNGELRIAVKAIECLVQKCVDMHEEIRLVGMGVINGRDGVTVDLRISLANNISIPLAVASLQKQIKQYLVASSGIDVREVRVSVDTAQSGVGESPYLVQEMPAPAQTEQREAVKPQKETKKPSLHQRIFSREEQKATMPTPDQKDQPTPAQEAEQPAPAPQEQAPAAENATPREENSNE